VQELQLPYKHSTINYLRFGNGPLTLVCFHGYGEEANVFEFLAQKIGSQYTVYAIDLPFHGSTHWKEGLDFNHADLLQIIRQIIPGENNQSFSLLGFSLGGRMALSLYQSIPDQIQKMVLLAPDGLKVNFWYWLATHTRIGNRFFAFTMKHPQWFFGMLKGMNRLGLINASIFKFVNYYVGNKEARDLLYTRWTGLRKLKPNLHIIKRFIRKFDTPVRLVYGKHDRIILSSVGERFRRGINHQCDLTIIASGHQVLHQKHSEEIMRSLLG